MDHRTWNQIGQLLVAVGATALALFTHPSSDAGLIGLAIWFHALTIDGARHG